MRRYILDSNMNRIEYTDARFYRHPETGLFYPSVTTVCQAYPKGPEYYEWLKKNGSESDEIRDAAGDRGSTVHGLTERYDYGEEIRLVEASGSPSFSMAEWMMLGRYVEFCERFNPVHDAAEVVLFSDKYKLAGTCDRVTRLMVHQSKKQVERKLVVDIKTSSGIHTHYWLQLVVYRKMLEDMGIETDGVAILWLNAKTRTEGKDKKAIQGKGWQMQIETNKEQLEKYMALFNATHKLWLEENGGITPNNTSFPIRVQGRRRAERMENTAFLPDGPTIKVKPSATEVPVPASSIPATKN